MVFTLSALWWRRIRGLWKLPDGRDWLRGKPGLVPMGEAMLSKSLIQSYGFSNNHVWMWELDYKKSRVPKNWCFWTAMLEKTLESPLDFKEIKPVNPKGNKPWIFIGQTDPTLKLQYFASGGQSIGASASVNIQDWFPLGSTGLISLLSKGLSRVFWGREQWTSGEVSISEL